MEKYQQKQQQPYSRNAPRKKKLEESLWNREYGPFDTEREKNRFEMHALMNKLSMWIDKSISSHFYRQKQISTYLLSTTIRWISKLWVTHTMTRWAIIVMYGTNYTHTCRLKLKPLITLHSGVSTTPVRILVSIVRQLTVGSK